MTPLSRRFERLYARRPDLRPLASQRVDKAPEGGGGEAAEAEERGRGLEEAAHRVAELGHGGHTASPKAPKPHGGHAAHAGAAHPAAPSGGHAPAAQGEHQGGGEHGGHEAPKEKPTGHGDGRQRDEHGRFAGKRAAWNAAARKSFEGAWGHPYPIHDWLDDEDGDFAANRAQKDIGLADLNAGGKLPPVSGGLHAPAGVAEPDDYATERDLEVAASGLDGTNASGANNPALVDAWAETTGWELGGNAPDADWGDGGNDPSMPDTDPPVGPGEEEEPSIFDQPYRTELRAKAYRRAAVRALTKRQTPGDLLELWGPPDEWSGAIAGALGPGTRDDMKTAWAAMTPEQQAVVRARWAASMTWGEPPSGKGDAEYNAGGDGLDDHPWGNPRMFGDTGAFENPDDAWVTARRKAVGDEGDAAIAVVFDTGGRVLCVSRPEPPHELAIVGGAVDEGESPMDAAVRETLEETGVEVHDLEPVGFIVSPTDGRKVHVFVVTAWAGEAHAAEPNTSIGWLTPDELLAQSQLYASSVRQLMAAGVLKRSPIAAMFDAYDRAYGATGKAHARAVAKSWSRRADRTG